MPLLNWLKAESCFSREVDIYGLFSSWIHEINSKGLTNVCTMFQGEITLLIRGSWFGMGFFSFFLFFF